MVLLKLIISTKDYFIRAREPLYTNSLRTHRNIKFLIADGKLQFSSCFVCLMVQRNTLQAVDTQLPLRPAPPSSPRPALLIRSVCTIGLVHSYDPLSWNLLFTFFSYSAKVWHLVKCRSPQQTNNLKQFRWK